MKLDHNDLRWILRRLPAKIKKIMEETDWHNNIFIGGGFIRSIIASESINDIDLFVKSKKDAELLAYKLSPNKEDVITTDNAYTIKGAIPIQIVHRWLFEKAEDVSDSFDFTVCCAVIYYNGVNYDSYCDDRYYIDLSSKRLIYRSPVRNEDAGGSLLRVSKFIKRGYNIPLDSLAAVIARLISGLDIQKNESDLAKDITVLLREVDPEIDPLHRNH